MKKSIICFLVFAVGLFSSALQAQILSAGENTEFSIGAGTIVSADSLELTPSAIYSFSNNTLSKSNAVSNSTSINHINKVYQFSATASPYYGVLKIYYNNSQLNGIAASGLKLLVHNGTSWSLDNTSSSIEANNVVLNNSVSGVSLKEITAAACSPNTGDTTASACGSFVWYGVTYTSSATPTHTFTNAGGCDSVVTLYLTINNGNHNSFSVSECIEYSWHDVNYSESGDYTFNYDDEVTGCPSVDTLHLVIKQPTSKTITQSACESFLWNGTVYNESVFYTKSGLTNFAGCDSTVYLNLTILHSTTSITRYAACSSSLPYNWNGTAYSVAGSYIKHLTNAAGCDSAATLLFTVSTVVPGSVATITQTLVSNVCGARVYRYKATKVANAVGYAWTLPTSVGGSTGVTIDSGDVTRDSVIRVKYASNAAAITGDSIKVRAWSGCGNSVIKAYKLSNTVLAVPAAPTGISITAVSPSTCGAKIYRYRAPSITTAMAAGTTTVAPVTGYLWSFKGTLGANAVVDSGTVNSQVILVKYTSNNAATIGDSVRVSYTSLCGNSSNKAVKLTNVTSAVPSVPTSITITAKAATVCGERLYRYTAPALPISTSTAAPASGYVWSFKGSLGDNAVIDSGSLTSRIIVMRYTSNNAAATGDSVKLYYTSSCGNSLVKASKLSNTLLTAPSIPTDITITLVSDVCGARVYRYAAPLLPVATSTAMAASGYEWSLPTGSAVAGSASLDSGELSGANARYIRLKFTNNMAAVSGDSIRLRYSSGCGLSSPKATKLSNSLLTAPAIPSAITITLVSDVCGARVYRYAAPVLPIATTTAMAATGYEWSLPTGSAVAGSASLDSGELSGANARYIKLKFTNNKAAVAGDSIRLRYTSGCSLSSPKAQKLSNLAAATLSAPITLTGTTSICPIVGTTTSARYIASAVTGAVSYLWTLPSGALIDSGSNGLKIKVLFNSATSNDSIYVQAIGANGCVGSKKVLKLTTKDCITQPITKVTNAQLSASLMDVMLYPNPTSSAYSMLVKSSTPSQSVKATIIDLQGRIIKTLTFNSNETISFGNELKSGVYMIEIRQGNMKKTMRVVKE